MAIDWESFFSMIITYAIQALFRVLFCIGSLLGLRYGLVPTTMSVKPSRKLLVRSSKDPSRSIKVHVFEPPSHNRSEGQLPVHINFHGCGFVLPVFGSDAELCAHWASTLNCIVLDADYGKGPIYPHPTPTDDALDVFKYVASHRKTFDVSKVTAGGFSSGANIAILASLRVPKDVLQIKALVAWYPPTDLTRAGEEQMSSAIKNRIHRAFRHSYLPSPIDRMDPKVSPLYADSNLFPPLTLIVGEEDKLLSDSIKLAEKLQGDGKDCVLHTVPGAGHARERFLKDKTPLWEERKKALSLMECRLREVYDPE